MCEDTWYLEVVQKLEDDHVNCSFMKRHGAATGSLYWSWPSVSEEYSVHKQCILPIRPCVEVTLKYSSNRNIVFILQNEDLINKFAQ